MTMRRDARIFVAGSRGLVGSAIVRRLQRGGYSKLITPSSDQLDLMDPIATLAFFKKYSPEYIFMAAAKVGGIWANMTYPAEFCHVNLGIQNSVIHGAYEVGVKKLLFLGSSCIYPKHSEIPIKESSLLTGPLEPTNEAYAIAKVAGVKMCEYYRKQYGCDFISVMPTNTFGPFDNYDLQTAHMIPSLLHKFHLAKIKGEPTVSIWGTGAPRREMIYVDDVADACLFLIDHYSDSVPINVGSGDDFSIAEVAALIQKTVNFPGNVSYDTTKPDGVYRKVMDVSRVRDLGWRSQIPIEEGMKLAYDWLEKNYANLMLHPSYKKKPIFVKSPKAVDKIKRFVIHPLMANRDLDDPESFNVHKAIIQSKPFMVKVYLSHYIDFLRSEQDLGQTPGISLEIGSGGGFLKSVLPSIVTSEVMPVEGVDRVEDAAHLSFKDQELRAIYMSGVLHHIGKPREFFKEAVRCLREGGRIIMMEPNMSIFGKFFFKVLHHEGNDTKTLRWEFPQIGPLSSANTALPYILFDRDWEQFQCEFPELKMVKRRYHTFMTYLLSGGVGYRLTMPGWCYPFFAAIETLLTPFMRRYLGTMQTIVLEKNKTPDRARHGDCALC